jgi:hypothetical protein
VISLLLAAAVIVAVVAVATRRLSLATRRRLVREGPGSSEEHSIAVRSFADMDASLDARVCPCGGDYDRTGEGSREAGGRRYRVARLVCRTCEQGLEVFFDTTDVLH